MWALPGGQVVGAGTGTSWEGQGEPRGRLTDQRRESVLPPSTVVLKSEAWYQRGKVNLEEAETCRGHHIEEANRKQVQAAAPPLPWRVLQSSVRSPGRACLTFRGWSGCERRRKVVSVSDSDSLGLNEQRALS